MNKQQMKANGIDSPNEGDSVMMTLITPPDLDEDEPINFTSLW